MALAFAPRRGLFELSDSDDDSHNAERDFLPEYALLPELSKDRIVVVEEEDDVSFRAPAGVDVVVRLWGVAGVEVALCAKKVAASGYANVGAVPWDSAFVLGKFLEFQTGRYKATENRRGDHKDAAEADKARFFDVAGKTVVELGCGIGTSSVAAALLGASAVTVTDVFDEETRLRDMLESNVRHNLTRRGHTAEIRELRWGEDVLGDSAGRPRTFDVVMAGDCLYRHESVLPFLETVRSLCHAESHVFVFNQCFQEEATDLFWREARRHFVAREIEGSEVHPQHRAALDNGSMFGALLRPKKQDSER